MRSTVAVLTIICLMLGGAGLATWFFVGSDRTTDRVTSAGAGYDATTAPEGVTGDSLAPPISTETSVSTGPTHSCMILSYGGARCWGANHRGQLGNGTTYGRKFAGPDSVRQEAVRMPAGVAFTQIAAQGERHTCALDSRGAVWCWGSADFGMIGDAEGSGDVPDRVHPTRVQLPGGVTIEKIAAGLYHTCALQNTGTVWCWGATPLRSQEIVDVAVPIPTPIPTPTGVRFTDLATGRSHTCALTDQGSAWCWGSLPGEVQLDEISDFRPSPTPVPTSTSTSFTTIAAGNEMTCALDTAGAAWCWGTVYGATNKGEIEDTTQPIPIATPADLTFRQITVGDGHACALTITSIAWCWGWNASGQVGVGTEDLSVHGPTELTAPTDMGFAHVSAGGFSTCAVDLEANVWCWGSNEYGQLGDGSTTDRPSPQPLAAIAATSTSEMVDGGCGSEHCAGIWRDGTGSITFEAWSIGDLFGEISVCVVKVTEQCAVMRPEKVSSISWEWRLAWADAFPDEGPGWYMVTMTSEGGLTLRGQLMYFQRP